MTLSAKLKQLLDNQGIRYQLVSHPRAYTAQEIAAAAHIPGQVLAKTVIVKADGRFVMVVLPASSRITFSLLKQTLQVEKLELATEEEFKTLFPDCEIGAMPPLGNLYNLPVYAEEALLMVPDIAFVGGTHNELVRMARTDYQRLVQPNWARFSEPLS